MSSTYQPQPLLERDPNISSGRTSRASKSSAGSKTFGRNKQYHTQYTQHASSHHGYLGHQHLVSNNGNKNLDFISAAPGVMGMLRTTMEIGDVGSLAVSGSRGHNLHHHHHNQQQQQYPLRPSRRAGTTSRTSNGSSKSQNQSVQTRSHSKHQVWSSVSSAGRRRSFTNVGALPVSGDAELIPGPGINGNDPGITFDEPVTTINRRSMSMTTDIIPPGPIFGFSNYKSISSLRSAPPRSREVAIYAPPGQNNMLRYPIRLKRLGYRPSSPALNDVAGLSQPPFGRYATSSGYAEALSGPSKRSNRNLIGHPPVSGRSHFPYPAHRNRSAPAVVDQMHTIGMIEPQPSFQLVRRGPTPVPPADLLPVLPVHQHHHSAGPHYKTSALSVSTVFGSVMQLRSHPALGLHPSSDNDPPTSSPPPTPGDDGFQASFPVIVDSKPVAPQYYDYTEDYDFEKEVSFAYAETIGEESPVPLPVGLIDRVRALLAETEKTAKAEVMPSPMSPSRDSAMVENSQISNVTGTAIGSPVVKRITREMILAALAPSSSFLDTTESDAPNDFSIEDPDHLPQANRPEPKLLLVETDGEDFQSCNSESNYPDIEEDRYLTEKNEDVLFEKKCGRSNIASMTVLDQEPLKVISVERSSDFIEELESLDPEATKPESPIKIASSVYTTTSPGSLDSRSPTLPAATDMESTLDKAKTYWSVRRFIAAPPSTRSLSSAPDVGLRSSDSLVLKKAMRTSTSPELSSQSREERELVFDSTFIKLSTTQQPNIQTLVEPEIKHDIANSPLKSDLPIPSISLETSSVTHTISGSSYSSSRSIENQGQKSFKKELSPSNSASEPQSSSSSVGSVETRHQVEHLSNKLAAVVANFSPTSSNSLNTHKSLPLRTNAILPDVQEEPSLESCVDLRTQVVASSAIVKPTETRVSIQQGHKRRSSQTVGSTSTRASIGKALLDTLRLQQLGHNKEKRKSIVKGSSKDEHSRSSSINNRASNSYGVTTTVTANGSITSAEPIQQENKSLEIVTTTTTTLSTAGDVFASPVPGLLEAHTIPSLNFSSINLLSKLNDVLELRNANVGSEFESLLITDDEEVEVESPEDIENLVRDVVDDVEILKMREKYRSLFLGLDDFEMPATADAAFVKHTSKEEYVDNNEEDDANLQTSETQHVPTFRPLSPFELLEEVRRISIPSVTGLTQRLSELLPNIKSGIGEEEEVGDNIPKHRVSETRYIAQEEVVEKQRDSLDIDTDKFNERKSIENTRQALSGSFHANNISNGEPKSVEPVKVASTASFVIARPYSVSHNHHMEEVEVDGTLARLATGRLRSLSDSDVDWALSERASRVALTSHRSLTDLYGKGQGAYSNSPEPRPWNLDSSYPWSNSIPYMDIHFPVPSPGHAKLNSLASPLRRAVSSCSSDDSSSALIVPPIAFPPVSAPPTLSNATINNLSRCGSTRTSTKILNTLSLHRRAVASVPRHSRKTSEATNKRSSNKTASDFLPNQHAYASSHEGSSSAVLDVAKAVDPGDRYPTSGLGAPSQAVLGWDEVQSFFSEDSNEDGELRQRRKNIDSDVGSSKRGTRDSIRMRMGKTKWKQQRKSKGSLSNRENSRRKNRQEPEEEPAAMPHHEVNAKKLVTKLKTLLWRGSELFRTMSGRKRGSLPTTRNKEVIRDTALEEGAFQETDESWSEEGENLTIWGGIVGGSGLASGYDAGRLVMERDVGRQDSRPRIQNHTL